MSPTCSLADPGEVLRDPYPSHTLHTKSQQGDVSTHGVCRTLGLLHRFCQWCILSHWLGSHISHILSDRCEFIRMAFDIRHRRFGPRTHSGSPVWWTHVTCCTAVNQHELSAGANPGQQMPQTSNACQWRNSSIRRFQLSLLSPKRHPVAIGDQSSHRQNRVSNVHNFKRHFCWS